MIQNVIDLRKNQWKPRLKDNDPKTFAHALGSEVTITHFNLLFETKLIDAIY